MKHALIISDNLIIACAMQERLRKLGFTSFNHVWSEDDAVAAADRKTPDLVLVADGVESGSALNAARRVNERCDAPVLFVTGDCFKARSCLPQGTHLSRPFLLSELDRAVATAVREANELVDAGVLLEVSHHGELR
jgi:CheY-like chemotaxis protein